MKLRYLEACEVAEERWEDWLKTALSQGQLESSGAFTLDFESARRKFGEFALPEPLSAVARVIRAGVLSGAARVDVELGKHSTRVQFSAFTLPLEHLNQVFERLLSDVPMERELAIGLNSMAARDLRSLTVTRCETSRIAQLQVSARREVQFGMAYDLTRTESLTRVDWQHARARNVGADLEQLRRWFAYSPAAVIANGTPLQQAFGSPRGPGMLRHLGAARQVLIKPGWFRPATYFWADHHALEFRLFSPRAERNHVRVPTENRASTYLSAGAPRRSTCYMLVGFGCDPQAETRVDWVYRGQLVDSSLEPTGYPGVHAVVSCEGLPFDLSGEKPVAGTALAARRQFLQDWVHAVDDYLESRYRQNGARQWLPRVLYDKRWRGRTLELPRTPRVAELLQRMT